MADPFLHNWRNSAAAFVPYTPPTDIYLQNATGFDDRVDLTNWLTQSQNGTHALNATDWLGTPNGSNTWTGSAATGVHLSTSWLMSAGCQTFGGAFKAGTGAFVSIQEGGDNTAYGVFNLTAGTCTSGGTAVASIHQLTVGGWYWCSVLFAAPFGANKTMKFNVADTALNAVPNTSWTDTGQTFFCGPFAVT